MARFEQFEIWEFDQGHWQFIAAFKDFDLAHVMARRRSYRVRLLRVVYEQDQPVEQEVLSEIGATRDQP